MHKVHFEKGFTIIELLVVVAIIAILTAITTANFTTSKAKSRDAKRVSDVVQMQLAMELFFDRCNRYPDAVNGVPKLDDSLVGCPVGIKLDTFTSKTLPTNGDYLYVTRNTPATDYVIQAKLEQNNSSLIDDMDAPPSGTGWTIPSGLLCTDTSPNFYFCVQPR